MKARQELTDGDETSLDENAALIRKGDGSTNSPKFCKLFTALTPGPSSRVCKLTVRPHISRRTDGKQRLMGITQVLAYPN